MSSRSNPVHLNTRFDYAYVDGSNNRFAAAGMVLIGPFTDEQAARFRATLSDGTHFSADMLGLAEVFPWQAGDHIARDGGEPYRYDADLDIDEHRVGDEETPFVATSEPATDTRTVESFVAAAERASAARATRL